MATNPKKRTYDPEELKTLFEALSIAPSYLSKRFILKEMLGWSDEDLALNLKLMQEESDNRRINAGKGY